MRARQNDGPTLFDDLEPERADRFSQPAEDVVVTRSVEVGHDQRAGESPAALSTWREVPQALFLSWPPAMQAAYCAARDYDAAEHEDALEWCEFYLQRAARYAEESETR